MESWPTGLRAPASPYCREHHRGRTILTLLLIVLAGAACGQSTGVESGNRQDTRNQLEQPSYPKSDVVGDEDNRMEKMTESAPQNLVLLEGSNLTEVLIGKPFTIIAPEQMLVHRRITLLPNGMAVLEGHRAPVKARYSIDRDQLCISTSSGRIRCSRFHQSSAGAIYEEFIDRPGKYFKLRLL